MNDSVYQLGLSSQRLASGQRINRASDDAAGLAIASSLNKDSRVYTQAIRNGNDAISALAIAEGTAQELTSVLIRMRELASQAASGTFSRTQRLSLDAEGKSLTSEFNRLSGSTTFNGINLLNGSLGRLNIQLGYGTNGTIGFGLGEGLTRKSGTGFDLGVQTNVGNGVITQAIADFNKDGKLDIATVGGGGSELQLHLGNGDGSFGDKNVLNNIDIFRNVVSGDFDHDGNIDLAVSEESSAKIVLYIGNGNGTFKSGQNSFDNGTVDLGADLQVADLNGDGYDDIVASSMYDSSLHILLGGPGGNFTKSSTLATDFQNKHTRLADFNGDGKTDILSREGNQTDFELYLGNGNGTFGAAKSVASASTSDFVAGDVNYDGIVDIISQSNPGGAVSIELGNGDGTFKSSYSLDAQGSYTGKFVVADMNGDGIVDITASGGDLCFFRGNGDGSFAAMTRTYTNSLGDAAIYSADFNNDGVNDISMNGSGDQTTTLLLASTTNSTQLQRINLTTRTEALSSLSVIDAALNRVQKELGNIGSNQSRISSALNNLAAVRENSAAAASRIMDVDVAYESARLTSLQILRQSGAAVLAQANQAPQLALSLLKLG